MAVLWTPAAVPVSGPSWQHSGAPNCRLGAYPHGVFNEWSALGLWLVVTEEAQLEVLLISFCGKAADVEHGVAAGADVGRF